MQKSPAQKSKVNLTQALTQLKQASESLRAASASQKNAVLEKAAALLQERRTEILKANAEDVSAVQGKVNAAFIDRLTLNETRISHMAESLRQVAALQDPVEEEVERRTLANGLLARRIRSPLGVILMIFESRPNVAVESFSLAFKAGNAIILRGGKESMRTTAVLYSILGEAIASSGLPGDCLWGITDPDRALTESLLKERRFIDVVVPRGGDQLIEFVVENSLIPIIKNDRGLCHIYVHADADEAMAEAITLNAKTQRPGVCNAMETLLVHRSRAARLLPKLHTALSKKSVQWFGCPETKKILKGMADVASADEQAWDTEYLDLKMNCRVVDSLEQAIEHIETHGSRHSEGILTKDESVARKFQKRVDAAAVYWNASTRFTDGFELGLGGELGISTQKLHVRGPVGLRELTSVRWVIDGTGQVRK